MQGTPTAEKAKSASRAAFIIAITYLYASNEGDTKSLCAAMQWKIWRLAKIGEQELQDPMLGTVLINVVYLLL